MLPNLEQCHMGWSVWRTSIGPSYLAGCQPVVVASNERYVSKPVEKRRYLVCYTMFARN